MTAENLNREKHTTWLVLDDYSVHLCVTALGIAQFSCKKDHK